MFAPGRGRPAGGGRGDLALRRNGTSAVRTGPGAAERTSPAGSRITAVLRGLVDAAGGDGRARREPADRRPGIRRRVVGDGNGEQRRGFGQQLDRRARGHGSRRARGGGVGPRVDRSSGPDRRDRFRPRPLRSEKRHRGARHLDQCRAQPGASNSVRGFSCREPVARPGDARHPIRRMGRERALRTSSIRRRLVRDDEPDLPARHGSVLVFARLRAVGFDGSRVGGLGTSRRAPIRVGDRRKFP